MNIFTKKKVKGPLDDEIETVIKFMNQIQNKSCDDYQQHVAMLERLTAMNEKLKGKDVNRERLSPNTIAVVVGGLLEMGVIMTYERGHVIATKAFNRILRGRV